MLKYLRLLVLLLYFFTAQAQEPTINWGPEIAHNNRNLNQLQLIGTGPDNSFYTRYTDKNQITLERYDQYHQRIWSVCIAPLSPDGARASLQEMVLLNGQVYLLSTVTEKFKKNVFIQQIDRNGNYMPTIHLLAATTPDAVVHAQTKNGRLLLVLQQQTEPQQTKVASYQGSFKPTWSETIPVKGTIQELKITDTGTTYILTQLPATNSPEAAFYLYRFDGRNGNSSTQPIGNTAQRPLQAKLDILNGDVIVAGITAPAPYVANQHPEPTGTFFYRFPKGRFRKFTQQFAPIDSVFLHDYKASKPDQDHSQRLRHLELHGLLPLAGNKVALLGEVFSSDARSLHTDDVLVFAFDVNGNLVYTTSANKHQTGPANQVRLGSYIATSAQDTIKLVFLDFEYNYNEQDEITIASPRAVLKTPVLATIAPDAKTRIRPLRNTQTGRHQDFYLVPVAAYKLNRTDFIVLGSGKGYYKFGRLKF